jgi:hypothetical protein
MYWLLLTGNSLCGKNARARIVTDKETEDFHSELPSRIAVLLAIQVAYTATGKRKLQYVFRQPGG